MALADPTRRAIFETVAKERASVSELVARFPISQPAVSQHLRVLREARLVEVQKSKNRRIYSVRKDGLLALRSYVDMQWTTVLESFARGIEIE